MLGPFDEEDCVHDLHLRVAKQVGVSADQFFVRVPKQNTEGRAEACGSCDTAGGHILHARSGDVRHDGSRFDGRMGLPGVWCQKCLANQSSLLPVGSGYIAV